MSKPCVDHLGNKFDSITNMCKHWNINQSLFLDRQKRDWSLEESLCGRQLNKSKKPCVDHLGNKFDSETKMCKHWNIHTGTFRDRQKRGWSLEESLCGRQLNKCKKPCVDHLGNKFDSINDMCEYWNVDRRVFQNRQKLGWSLEKSLCKRQSNKKQCTDHLGNKFDSEKDMCEYWNINQGTFQRRQKKGWSLEKSLCAKSIDNSKQCVDHLGNKFDSQKEMCRHWNIRPGTFRERQKLGWSLEESLYRKNVTDHIGNKFDSEKDMCRHWGINSNTFRQRQKQGWSLEESLCAKNNNLKSCIDHLGNKFDSEKDMCKHWDINQSTFRQRQKQNWSLPETLGVIPRLKVTQGISKAPFQNYNLTPNITIIDNVPDTNCYFICLVNNKDKTIYHKSELINEYVKYSKKQRG